MEVSGMQGALSLDARLWVEGGGLRGEEVSVKGKSIGLSEGKA